jgi:dimeric dUTPase (all-alpha-NTP-PPase superfamily)
MQVAAEVGLDFLLHEQHFLQTDSFHVDPTKLEGAERAAFLHWNLVALDDELHEALQEVSWKPWAKADFLNREAFLKEMVDAFHFFMNILMIAAPEGDLRQLSIDFIDGYLAKKKINAQRQVDGYDGVTSKCPNCHRELSEVGVTTLGNGRQSIRRCNGCQARVDVQLG